MDFAPSSPQAAVANVTGQALPSTPLSEATSSKEFTDMGPPSVDERLPGLGQQFGDEATTVERLFAATKAEGTDLRSPITVYYASLDSATPIHSIPVEILSEIFLYYLFQPFTNEVFQDIMTSHRVRSSILLVCHRWYSTALNDPRLWTTIPFVGSGAYPLIFDEAAYWQALERRIERTSALPLDLLLHLHTERDIGNSRYALSAFRTFLDLFSRAKSISIVLRSFGQDIVEVTPRAHRK